MSFLAPPPLPLEKNGLWTEEEKRSNITKKIIMGILTLDRQRVRKEIKIREGMKMRKKIQENTTFISYNDLLSQLIKINNRLQKSIDVNNPNPFLFSDSVHMKSNDRIAEHFTGSMKLFPRKLTYYRDDIIIKDGENIIIFDDAMHSGEQTLDIVSDIISSLINQPQQYKLNINIAIPYISRRSLRKLNELQKIHSNVVSIHIPESIIYIPNCYQR